MDRTANITLRPFESGHLEMLAAWLREPHVAPWFPEPAANLQWAAQPPSNGSQRVICADERAVGWLRWQHVSRDALDALGLRDVPANSVDADILLGEGATGSGAGPSALSLLVERLRLDGAPMVGLTSNVANVSCAPGIRERRLSHRAPLRSERARAVLSVPHRSAVSARRCCNASCGISETRWSTSGGCTRHRQRRRTGAAYGASTSRATSPSAGIAVRSKTRTCMRNSRAGPTCRWMSFAIMRGHAVRVSSSSTRRGASRGAVPCRRRSSRSIRRCSRAPLRPHIGWRDVFPVIVTSWQERTLDKAALCAIALQRLDDRMQPGGALLVDNKADNVAAWIARGGRGYVFRGPSQFETDLRGELAELAAACGTRG